MTGVMAESPARYQFKAGPYSSHTLLMNRLPAAGADLRVLDVGCAGGYLSALLAGRGFAVTGVDLPGATPPPGIQFVAADLDHGLPPLEGRFDLILCADVLEHVRDPQRLLRECRAHLAPGGKLVASLPNSGHAYFRLQVLLGRFPQHDKGLFDRTHLHFYTWDGWRDLFARGGFRIGSVDCSGVPVGLALPRWEHTAMVKAMERLSFESARLWKTLFAYQFIVEARPEGVE
jgi:SAM-dependent methyltransferase